MAFPKSSLAYFALAVAMAGLAATTTVVAQNTPQDFVRLHNQARARDRVGPVHWDGRVARYAHDYAAKRAGDCRMEHSLNGRGPYGENIFWGPAGRRAWSAADAVASWVEEKKWYRPGTNACFAPPGKTCGHYTQVVWRRSTAIGCARVVCTGGRHGVFIVCSYSPRGNIHGQRPF